MESHTSIYGGAFQPHESRRNNVTGSPPRSYPATCMSSGLKFWLGEIKKRKDLFSSHGNPSGFSLQTDECGRFRPSHPVPCLAGRYKFLQVIGEGQSSVIIAAEDTFHPSKQAVAIKVMNLSYKNLGAQEAECIQQLNKADPLKVSKTIRLLNKFIYGDHYCMVFKLLRPRPLHRYFQNTHFDNEESKYDMIKEIGVQLIGVLGFLKREGVIHADLKPENILLQEGERVRINVVDFGNAIRWVHKEMSLYYNDFELQTLLYRAPEVMFGVPFGQEIDMWSLGCILAELYLGKPLFFGRTKTEVLHEIVEILGPLPRVPFQSGKFYSELVCFANQKPGHTGSAESRLMKKLYNTRNYMFANFLNGLLTYNPVLRVTPVQAARHPFLSSEFPLALLCSNTSGDIDQHLMNRPTSSGILLTKREYPYTPNIDEGVRRQRYSGIELLRAGTKGISRDTRSVSPPVGRVMPLVHTKAESTLKGKCVTDNREGNINSIKRAEIPNQSLPLYCISEQVERKKMPEPYSEVQLGLKANIGENHPGNSTMPGTTPNSKPAENPTKCRQAGFTKRTKSYTPGQGTSMQGQFKMTTKSPKVTPSSKQPSQASLNKVDITHGRTSLRPADVKHGTELSSEGPLSRPLQSPPNPQRRLAGLGSPGRSGNRLATEKPISCAPKKKLPGSKFNKSVDLFTDAKSSAVKETQQAPRTKLTATPTQRKRTLDGDDGASQAISLSLPKIKKCVEEPVNSTSSIQENKHPPATRTIGALCLRGTAESDETMVAARTRVYRVCKGECVDDGPAIISDTSLALSPRDRPLHQCQRSRPHASIPQHQHANDDVLLL
ncbi:serine/threonine-protein kinase unc-51 isoform X1 [Nematostella vectensis]|uniref:serine/threonine-protein kinase unc-51 isoform X1 n=2 Tax=Nematostella vectensis TaxID=45351 RepID=UPI0020773D79|nr:serine/threonine-protein kinase unc-51 isoform X1 [Nematostella vectensis]